MAATKGEKIRFSAQFTDDSGDNTTPGTPVTVTIKAPDGTKPVDGTTVTEGTTGYFEYKHVVSQHGVYYYKFVSSDGAEEVGDKYIKPDLTE